MIDDPAVNAKIIDAAKQFQRVIQDRAFRDSLDAMSMDMLARMQEVFDDHMDLVRTHCQDMEPEDLIAAVCGWILGFAAGKADPGEPRIVAGFHYNTLAAYVSVWSMENAARVFRTGKH